MKAYNDRKIRKDRQTGKCLIMLIGITLSLWYACSPGKKNNKATTIPIDKEMVAKGQELFINNCSACHNFRQRGIGPNLAGVTSEVEINWLQEFIRNAPEMIEKGDERAVRLYREYNQYMPAFTMLGDTSISAIIAYMHTHQKKDASKVNDEEVGKFLKTPLPEKIKYSGTDLVLEEVVQAPASAEQAPLARINKLLTLSGKKERTFINDLRGKLYELSGKTLHVFLDLSAYFPDFIDKPGLGTGFGSFAFHPDYGKNGLFYTTHTEKADAAHSDFAYADSIKVALQWVLTEWNMKDPSSANFSGSHREVLRINMVGAIHGVQEIAFNPLADPGNPDYGMLYIGIGEGGVTGSGYPFLCHDPGRPWGTIFRINPRGNNSRNGAYGIPGTNPLVDDKGAITEIWAYGFRNPHRLSWYKSENGETKMLASDIGQDNVEEVNLIEPGADYGWNVREGTFRLYPKVDASKVYPLPENDRGFTYPVAQYGHDEGNAISGGFVYIGKDIPTLQGKYIFGDIPGGKLFYVESDQLKPGRQAVVQRLGLQVGGKETTLEQLTKNKRVDLRFGEGPGKELYIFTKADGKVWKIAGVSNGTHDLAIK